ncbi:hypothetical protein ACKKBG_A26995 [Auxenochlorella protothecoides x Auxenochlorella symbiontica]
MKHCLHLIVMPGNYARRGLRCKVNLALFCLLKQSAVSCHHPSQDGSGCGVLCHVRELSSTAKTRGRHPAIQRQ